MAAVTSEDFKILIQEQQKTNMLLEEGNRDPSLASSIKQNAGEIGNAIILAGRSEKFAKDEGTTEVDEKVDQLKDINKTFLQRILDRVSGIFKLTPSMSIRMSQKKGEESFLKKLLKPLAQIPKGFEDLKKGLTDKGGLFDFGGFIGKTKLFALLALLPLFLNSPLFETILKRIDTILGFLPKLNEKFKPVGELIDRIGDKIGIDNLTDVLTDIAKFAGVFAIFSKKFRTRLIGFLNTLFNPFSKKFFLRRLFRFMGLGGDDIKKAADANKVKGGFFKQIGGFFGQLYEGMKKTLRKNIGLIIKSVFTGLKVALLGVPFVGTIITAGIGIIEGLLAGIKTYLEGGTLKESFFAFVDGFVESVTFIFTLPKKLIDKFFPDLLPNLKESIIEKFNKFIKEPFVNAFNKTMEDVGNFFNGIFEPIVEIVKTQMIIFSEIKESISKGIDDFVGFFRDIGDDIESFRSKFSINTLDVLNKIKSGIEKIDEFLQSIRNLFKAIALGGKAAFKAALPGGKTPQEAFAETFDSVMNTGNANDIAASSETGGSADAMNENALNKMEGGQTTIVQNTNVDQSNNSKQEVVNNYSKPVVHNNSLHVEVANAD